MKKIISLFAIVAIIVGTGMGIGIQKASANPSQFNPISSVGQTAVATSTLTFMTSGTATTTIYLDSYIGNPGMPTDKAAIIEQFTGSSTSASLLTNVEYSQGVYGFDCTLTPTACDWYEDPGGFTLEYGTTTKAFNISQVNPFVLTYASSTPGLGTILPTGINPMKRIVSIGTPTRYIRAIFTMPVGSANGALWAQFIPQREAR